MNINSMWRLVEEYDWEVEIYTYLKSLSCQSCRDCDDFEECKGSNCAEKGTYVVLTDTFMNEYTYVKINDDLYYLRDVKEGCIIMEV